VQVLQSKPTSDYTGLTMGKYKTMPVRPSGRSCLSHTRNGAQLMGCSTVKELWSRAWALQASHACVHICTPPPSMNLHTELQLLGEASTSSHSYVPILCPSLSPYSNPTLTLSQNAGTIVVFLSSKKILHLCYVHLILGADSWRKMGMLLFAS
jgi:hypothetical protein